MPYVLFVLICAAWGVNFQLMKLARQVFAPAQVGTARVLGGLAALLLIWWWQRGQLGWRRQNISPLLLIVLIGYAWPYALQPYLVAKHGGAFVGITVSFVPLLTVILSVPLMGIWPTRRQTLGVLGALCGMIALLSEGLQRSVPVRDMLLALTVPAGYAISNICIRRKLAHVPSLALSWQALLGAAFLLVPLSLQEPRPVASSQTQWTITIACLVMLGVVGTGLSNWMFNVLINTQGPLFAGMVTNLVPLWAVLLGWWDGEIVTFQQLLALVWILAMVTSVQYGAAKPPPQPITVQQE